MSHIFIDTETYGGSIDVRPLQELTADPALRPAIDPGETDVEAVLAMDRNRDGFLSFSEYMMSPRLVLETAIEEYSTGRFSPDYHNFLRLQASLDHISREMEARQLFPETAGMTSREACDFFRGQIDGPPMVLDASGLFFCRGDDLVDAARALVASGHAVMDLALDHILQQMPEDRRTDVIEAGLSNEGDDEMRNDSAGAIQYAPPAHRGHLFKAAFADPSSTTQIRRTVIEESVSSLADQHQVNDLIWLALQDPEPEVRMAAVTRLCRQAGGLASGSILYALSNDDDAEVRREAAAAIQWADPATKKFLVDLALDDRNVRVNRAALDLITEMLSSRGRWGRQDEEGGDSEWILDAFAKALRNPHLAVFEPAVRAIPSAPHRHRGRLVQIAADNPSFEEFLRGAKERLATIRELQRAYGRYSSYSPRLVEEEFLLEEFLEILAARRDGDDR